eukprot:snap_masked-scaffold_56-processed-gene-1.28-mRNA-1 protein AED:1.00 eAED:1.00 QI:0/0/0/0/1/1/2/0/63
MYVQAYEKTDDECRMEFAASCEQRGLYIFRRGERDFESDFFEELFLLKDKQVLDASCLGYGLS